MPTIRPTFEEFREKAAAGNLIPVYREMLADLETPVSAFKKLSDGPYGFLLESVEQGENVGRYSFLGADPKILFKSKGHEVQIDYLPDEVDFHTSEAPLDALRDFMARYKPVEDRSLPPFTGGAVGYIGYDMVRTLERLPDSNPDDLMLPDCFFMIAESMVIFDHVRRRMILLANAHVRDDVEAAYRDALHRIEMMAARLALSPLRESEPDSRAPTTTPSGAELGKIGLKGFASNSNARSTWRPSAAASNTSRPATRSRLCFRSAFSAPCAAGRSRFIAPCERSIRRPTIFSCSWAICR